MTTGIIVLIIIGFILWRQSKRSGKGGAYHPPGVILNDDYFEQYNVRVNFKEGTLTSNSYTFKVSQIKDVYLEWANGNFVTPRAHIHITVDDILVPVYTVRIHNNATNAGIFIERLKQALRKAGWEG